MLRPWYIAFLDLKRFLLNPGELAFSIALPVLLFALMYGAFGGGETADAAGFGPVYTRVEEGGVGVSGFRDHQD